MKAIHRNGLFCYFWDGVFVCPGLVAGTEHTQLCGSRESRGRRAMLKQPSRLLYPQADCDGGVWAIVYLSYM